MLTDSSARKRIDFHYLITRGGFLTRANGILSEFPESRFWTRFGKILKWARRRFGVNSPVGGRGHVGIWDIFLWGWGKGPCWNLGHFLVGMGELEHGSARICPPLGAGEGKKAFLRRRPFFAEFRAGVRQNTCTKHKDQRPLGWLFGAFRLLEIRSAFVSGIICSEKD